MPWRTFFDYDNSDFIEGLEDLGFWVADCSRSNYAFTVMSLSSELNMDYVYNLTDTPDLKTTSALIQNNKVFQAFEEVGYTTIAFNMGYSWGNMKGSDYYFVSYPEDIDTWEMDPFELMYLNSTLGRLLFTQSTELGAQVTLTDIERKTARTNLILDVLPKVPELDGPKFVYAHIINPHPPYVFNADGTINEKCGRYHGAGRLSRPTGLSGTPHLGYCDADISDIRETANHHHRRRPRLRNKYVTSNLLALYLPDGGDEAWMAI